eukprot:923622-Rhodomonas_salina.2
MSRAYRQLAASCSLAAASQPASSSRRFVLVADPRRTFGVSLHVAANANTRDPACFRTFGSGDSAAT